MEEDDAHAESGGGGGESHKWPQRRVARAAAAAAAASHSGAWPDVKLLVRRSSKINLDVWNVLFLKDSVHNLPKLSWCQPFPP
jgi:hypothetical protein